LPDRVSHPITAPDEGIARVTSENTNADVAGLPFEAALKELEGIVARLERGDVALEESIDIYTRGEALKARCDALLKQAEARIEKITLGADGKPTGTTPLDVDR
jgi:exodeoxyribonuclease VII small subunit